MITPKNILLVRTDRIGDVVLTLPLAEMIKKNFADCKISILVRKYTESLVINNPYIDEVIILEENNGIPLIKKNVWKLRSYNFDTTIVVYPTFKLALILYLSRIALRIGTGYRWYSFLFNKKVFEHRKDAKRHELEYNVGLLKQLNISTEINIDELKFNLCPSEISSNEIEVILKEKNIDNGLPIIIIHPGSGGSAVDLPIDKFKKLVEFLNTLKCQIIITGSKAEVELCNQLVINSSVINLAGQFDLAQMIALINKANIFISNSTGPLHIAAALGKFVVGFYPKILSCSAKRWGPYTSKRLIFEPPIKCNNCTREQCEKLNCMDTINLEEVFVKIKKINKLLPKNGEI